MKILSIYETNTLNLWAALSRYSEFLRPGRSGDRVLGEANFPRLLRTALGPTRPPIEWVSGYSWR